MWPDRVSNPGPLTYESGALPTVLPGPAENRIVWIYIAVMHPKDADTMANSVDPDQTAPKSGSVLFSQTYLS